MLSDTEEKEKRAMKLWIHWFDGVLSLRSACARKRTFVWMTLVLVGFSIRADLLGVTSFIRACFIREEKYRSLLYFFHTPALDLEKLTALWVKLVLRLFSAVTVNGYILIIADGIKVAKEGKKMPAVKSLHQESGDNSKPAFILDSARFDLMRLSGQSHSRHSRNVCVFDDEFLEVVRLVFNHEKFWKGSAERLSDDHFRWRFVYFHRAQPTVEMPPYFASERDGKIL